MSFPLKLKVILVSNTKFFLAILNKSTVLCYGVEFIIEKIKLIFEIFKIFFLKVELFGNF